jgi:hypothetical protein
MASVHWLAVPAIVCALFAWPRLQYIGRNALLPRAVALDRYMPVNLSFFVRYTHLNLYVRVAKYGAEPPPARRPLFFSTRVCAASCLGSRRIPHDTKCLHASRPKHTHRCKAEPGLASCQVVNVVFGVGATAAPRVPMQAHAT